jgi:hypothetical protein
MIKRKVQPIQGKFLTPRKRINIFLNRFRLASGIMLGSGVMIAIIVLNLITETFSAPLSHGSPIISSVDTGIRSEWVRGVIDQGLKRDIGFNTPTTYPKANSPHASTSGSTKPLG